MSAISIVSWNINGLRAVLKKGLLQFLNEQNADIYCFQEIKCFENQLSEDELKQLCNACTAYWHPAKRPGYSGVLTLDRGKILESKAGCGEEIYDFEGRILVHDLGAFELLNCYFPNGGSGEERHFFKMKFLEWFLKFASERQKRKPLVITGDINIAHTEMDIHDPVRLDGQSGFKPEEREWMSRFLAEGFVDVFRHFEPEARDQYSWWSYRAGARQRNKGWRIDYFLVSQALVPNLQKIQHFDRIPGSDHCPLRLDMKV